MKNLFKITTILAALLVFATGCTEQVPVGYVGKIVAPEGVTPEVYTTGRPTVMGRDRLVLIETASQLQPAQVNVIMADRVLNSSGNVEQRIGLNMDFVLNVRYRISSDKQVINAMLKDMTLDGVNNIGAAQVYRKYGNMVVGRVSREVLGKYTPEEVLTNLDAINATLADKISKGLQGSPLVVSEVSLGPITLPKVISDRINANKNTELSEAQKLSEQKIAMLEKNNEIALAKEQAKKELIDAQSLAAQNKVLNKSITKEVLELRRMEIQKQQLEVFRELGAKGNNNTIVLPYEALGNSGAQVRMFQK